MGGMLLIVFLLSAPRLEGWLVDKGFAWQLSISLLGPLILVLLNPTGDKYVLSMISVLMGVCTGFALERRFVRFSCQGRLWKRALRYLLGVVVLFGLWGGLKLVFSSMEPAAGLRFVRYALVGLWGGVGAPWVFVRLRLAEQEMRMSSVD